MYLHTSYHDQPANEQLAYISNEGKTPVYDRAGREMSPDEKTQFAQKSREHNHYRKFIISPNNGNALTEAEMRKETRRIADDFAESREDIQVAYAVHTDTDHQHSHVVVAGERSELEMGPEELEGVKETARERIEENERYLARQGPAKEWVQREREDRLKVLDGRANPQQERQSANLEDTRQRAYEATYGRENPAKERQGTNIADMRQQSASESRREAQREHTEAQKQRRETLSAAPESVADAREERSKRLEEQQARLDDKREELRKARERQRQRERERERSAENENERGLGR